VDIRAAGFACPDLLVYAGQRGGGLRMGVPCHLLGIGRGSPATSKTPSLWHQRRSGRKLAITVEPLRELAATHRRQLDDEVELVEARSWRPSRPLTVGTVTVGPHA